VCVERVHACVYTICFANVCIVVDGFVQGGGRYGCMLVSGCVRVVTCECTYIYTVYLYVFMRHTCALPEFFHSSPRHMVHELVRVFMRVCFIYMQYIYIYMYACLCDLPMLCQRSSTVVHDIWCTNSCASNTPSRQRVSIDLYGRETHTKPDTEGERERERVCVCGCVHEHVGVHVEHPVSAMSDRLSNQRRLTYE